MKKTIFFILPLLFCISGYSQSRPKNCPDIDLIKAQGLTYTFYNSQTDNYSAYSQSQFNSDYDWGFAIGPISAKNQDDALVLANELLQQASGNPKPKYNQIINAWTCEYDLPGLYRAFAATAKDLTKLNLRQ